jgi:tetratricopeptide (TPR) repeat protein
VVIWLLLLFGPIRSAFAEDHPGTNRFVALAERAYAEGLQRWRQNSNDVETGWQLGRACFDRAEYATNGAQRASLAEQGIAACRRAIELDAKSAPAHYYLALNVGQLARTKMFTALYLVNQLEQALKDSIALDPNFDFAGAHRTIGILYRDAPGWTVGSRSKARQNLEKAVALFPDYPGNQLCQLESWLEWGERRAVAARIPAVDEILEKARERLSGEAWEANWDEWDRRWLVIKVKAGAVKN